MKALLPLCLALLLASGCQPLALVSAPVPPVEDRGEDDWLRALEQVLELSEEQAQQQLAEFAEGRPSSPNRLFHYALLNQQLKDRLGWIRARDSLRQLQANDQLEPADRTLVVMLQQHNQAMINAQARYSRLLDALESAQQEQQLTAQALADSRIESTLLTEKIRALMKLEKSMSIRRALTTDTPKDDNHD